MITNEVTESEY